jgi:hypothetical protein
MPVRNKVHTLRFKRGELSQAELAAKAERPGGTA